MNKVVCVIPAAGKGRRALPLTSTVPKPMLLVAGLPIIYHILNIVSQAGVRNFVIVIGHLGRTIETSVSRDYKHLNVQFVKEENQKGLGHACLMAQDQIVDDTPLLLVHGDILFTANHLAKIMQSSIPMLATSIVSDPWAFGVVELDKNQCYVKKLVEKPKRPKSSSVIAGVNFFPNSSRLFSAQHYVIDNDIKVNNEYQVTDALQYMITNYNMKMQTFMLDQWYHCNTLLDIEIADKALSSAQTKPHHVLT